MGGVAEKWSVASGRWPVSKRQPFHSMLGDSPRRITGDVPDLLIRFDESSMDFEQVLESCVQSASIHIMIEGAVAQLGERLICIQEVAGSIPTSSTRQAGL